VKITCLSFFDHRLLKEGVDLVFAEGGPDRVSSKASPPGRVLVECRRGYRHLVQVP